MPKENAVLQILLIEDSDDDAELLRLALLDSAIPAQLSRVANRAGLSAALRDGSWDLIVCDHHLPDLDALIALDMIGAAGGGRPAMPVIVMSGTMETAEAVEAMHRGARDCMAKHDLPKLLPILEREIAHARAEAELRTARATLQQRAEQNPVTGLPNRARLELHLEALLHEQANAALLLIEVGRRSHAIRALLPDAGHKLQQEMARRLATQVGPEDFLAHMDDGSFALALPHCDSEAGLAAIAKRLNHSLEPPFELGDYRIAISSRIGACPRRSSDADAEHMLLAATAALLQVEARRGGAYSLYTPDMHQVGQRRLILESALHQALPRQEFELHYQPKASISDGHVVGAEALLRWRHPTLGPISPLEFVPILEDTGLIVDVGRWVIEEACRQACRWREEGLPPINIAVNLSANQFHESGLTDTIRDILAETQLPPERLVLEITERVAINGEAETLAVMDALHRLGVRIALDDFGADYSSLGYLKRFPIDSLKIDRMFITDLDASEADRNIVRAIVAMGHSLGLRVIAEGIETESQRAFLVTCECDVMQGYLYSRPLTAADFARFLTLAATQPAVAVE